MTNAYHKITKKSNEKKQGKSFLLNFDKKPFPFLFSPLFCARFSGKKSRAILTHPWDVIFTWLFKVDRNTDSAKMHFGEMERDDDKTAQHRKGIERNTDSAKMHFGEMERDDDKTAQHRKGIERNTDSAKMHFGEMERDDDKTAQHRKGIERNTDSAKMHFGEME